jgi:hypothetical protein
VVELPKVTVVVLQETMQNVRAVLESRMIEHETVKEDGQKYSGLLLSSATCRFAFFTADITVFHICVPFFSGIQPGPEPQRGGAGAGQAAPQRGDKDQHSGPKLRQPKVQIELHRAANPGRREAARR